MTGFQAALFGIRDAAMAKMPPHIVGADILQNNVVSQKNVVWVRNDRQAVRAWQI
jgi:hypothetical protein